MMLSDRVIDTGGGNGGRHWIIDSKPIMGTEAADRGEGIGMGVTRGVTVDVSVRDKCIV